MVYSSAYTHPNVWPSRLEPYTNPAAAVGLPVDIQPPLGPRDFDLAVFRGNSKQFLHISRYWDDEQLLQELSRVYDRLRGWRKYFSLKGLRQVPSDDQTLLSHIN
jgi:hypothetical protein